MDLRAAFDFMTTRATRQLAVVALLVAAACRGGPLPEEAPPLALMEEPLPLMSEPDDEAQRRSLPPGGFTGVYVVDARQSLDDMLDERLTSSGDGADG